MNCLCALELIFNGNLPLGTVMIFQEGHDVLRRNDNLQEPDDVINTIYDRYPK